ncbi:tetratricopeptide repeat protein [soil metagenome]
MKNRLIIPLLIVLSFLAFGRTIGNGFTGDDFPYLANNPAVRNFAGIGEFFSNPETATGGAILLTYRPLRTLCFAVEWRLFGESFPLYHTVNVVLHAAATILLLFVLRMLVHEPIAILAACIFAVHSLQTEVVASIKAQDDLLAAIFTFTALLVFLRTSGAWKLLILPLYALALCSKEGAIVLPALLGLASMTAGEGDWRARVQKLPLALLSVLIAEGAFFLLVRQSLLDHVPKPEGASPWVFFPALARVPYYWGLFLWPARLTIDYTSATPWPAASWQFAASITLQIGAAVLVLRSRRPLLIFGLAWFYLTVFPSLNSIVLFAERFMYLPLIGLALVAVDLAVVALGKVSMPSPRPKYAAAAVVLLLLGVRSAVRAGDWRDNETLFRAALRVHPDSPFVQNFLAQELIQKRQFDKALAMIPELPPSGPPRTFNERMTFANRAYVALQQGDAKSAAALYARMEPSPYMQGVDWRNAGMALAQLNDVPGAIAAMRQAVARAPHDPVALSVLGSLLLHTGDAAGARENFQTLLTLEPRNPAYWYYDVIAVRALNGDAAAAARLREARAAGISFGSLLRQPGFLDNPNPELALAIRDASQSPP